MKKFYIALGIAMISFLLFSASATFKSQEGRTSLIALTFTATGTPTPWASLTPFPTSREVSLIYEGRFTVLSRAVTIRDAHDISGNAVGSAFPGSTWTFDYPLYQNRETGDVWAKLPEQDYWMAIKYNGRYFSTWHE